MNTVAVIFGGQSAEHDVSVITALASVIKPLEIAGGYQIVPVYITKDGGWYSDNKLKDIALFQSDKLDTFLKKSSRIQLQFNNGLTIVKTGKFGRSSSLKIDVVFPAMHGTHGEDGELMGILEMANVPYVGCGVAASAVAMDKVLTKQVTQSAGIPTTPWVWFPAEDITHNSDSVLNKCNSLKYPLFVKPARLGSSIGITRVTENSQLINALEVAAHYDDKVIVEQAVDNLIEVTLPIMGNTKPIAALLEQPLLKSEDFFDFETKYMQGGKKGGKKGSGKQGAQGYSKLPADLPKDVYEKAEKLGLDVYSAIGCEGIARIDMLIDSKAKKVYFNEVNPLPGSLYAHNWRAAGISNVELVTKLIEYAHQRWELKHQKTTTFDTSYLKQFSK